MAAARAMRATVDPVWLARALRDVSKLDYGADKFGKRVKARAQRLRTGSLPILGHVLLEGTRRGQLALTMLDPQDMANRHTVTMPAADVATGETTVPAKLLLDLAVACKGFGAMTLEQQVQESLPLNGPGFDKRRYNRLWAQARKTGRPEVEARFKQVWREWHGAVGRVRPDGVIEQDLVAHLDREKGAKRVPAIERLEVRCPKFKFVAHVVGLPAAEFPPAAPAEPQHPGPAWVPVAEEVA